MSQGLPPGWEMKYNENGRPYFIDHSSKITTFDDPRTSQLLPQHYPQQAQQKSTPQGTQGSHPTSPGFPYGWETRLDSSGRPYFIDHVNKNSTYEDPREYSVSSPSYAEDELPNGWEMRTDQEGRPYFIDHINKKSTYEDPRNSQQEAHEEQKTYNEEQNAPRVQMMKEATSPRQPMRPKIVYAQTLRSPPSQEPSPISPRRADVQSNTMRGSNTQIQRPPANQLTNNFNNMNIRSSNPSPSPQRSPVSSHTNLNPSVASGHALPPGWEARLDSSQRVFYIDHNSKRTTYDDPRVKKPSVGQRPNVNQSPSNQPPQVYPNSYYPNSITTIDTPRDLEDDPSIKQFLQGSIKSGCMFKQGARVKNWKKRFFVLRNDGLTYFETIPERGKPLPVPKGKFELSWNTEVETNASPIEGRFSLNIKNQKRDLRMTTSTEQEMKEWSEVLNKAILNCQKPEGKNEKKTNYNT